MQTDNQELLDVYGEDGLETGEVLPKSEIHRYGTLHKIAQIWLLNDAGQLLLQKRSMTKKLEPGKWAITGGHVDAGEESKVAAARELQEELYIEKDPEELIYLGTVRHVQYVSDDYVENEIVDVYVTAVFVDPEEIAPNSEVDACKYFSLVELERVYSGEDALFALRPESFSLIKEYIYGPGQN